MRLTVKPFFPVVNPQRRKGFPGSLRILYRSTLTAKRVKIEVGTVVRYNVTLHYSRCSLKMKRDALYFKWLNYSVTVRRSDNVTLHYSRCSLKMKRDALYFKWLNYSVTVRRSDNANEKKMFVGFLRRSVSDYGIQN